MKTRYLFTLLVCVYTPTIALSGETDSLKLGTRTFVITQYKPNGTPVIHLWKAQMPTNNRSNAVDFPVLEEALHFEVWKPTNQEEGAYNHYPALFFHDGYFYAMWGNHLFCENGSGQRVLFSMSKNGREWEPPRELFSPPDLVLARRDEGIYLAPDRWVEVDGTLYAVAYVHVHGSDYKPYPIARKLSEGGVLLGEPFLLRDLPIETMLPKYTPTLLYNPVFAEKIDKWYEDNDMISWWARFDDKGIPSYGVDGTRVIEYFTFRSKEGLVACMRDYNTYANDTDLISSNRIYACFSNGEGGWSAAYPTDIPDSHSRAQAKKLPDGRVLLVGNQIASEFDKGLYLSRDPLTISVSLDGVFFTHVFALRSGGQDGTKHRFRDVPGSRPTGYGYPSMVILDDMIYVLYSINKEDISITIVPLASIHTTP